MNRELSRLALKINQRPGAKLSNGSTKSERNYIDFIVDGESLCERANRAGYDLVSVLAREWTREEREKSLQRLLLADPADFPNNRRSLLVCSECGDLGCGAISIVVDFSGDTVRWHEFGYENNYEGKVEFDKLSDLGPFEFDLWEYKAALARAGALLDEAQ